jgi:hypothetical protein
MPVAHAYIDGYNLYYNLLRDRFPDCKWLDLRTLAETLYGEHEIRHIRYFTANVTPPPDDPSQARRQQLYLRALRATGIDVRLGHFQPDRRTVRRLRECTCDGCDEPQWVAVRFFKEKRSDVNLATWLLRDAFVGEMEVAIVLTNDTDLVEPLKVAKHERGVRVELLSPSESPAKELLAVADDIKKVREGVLRDSQLPVNLSDGRGSIERPRAWRPDTQKTPQD